MHFESGMTEEVKLDQLEVKETLASARRALHTHRDWMRRRNPSISPLPPDDPLSFSPKKRCEPAWDREDTGIGVTSKAAISPIWSLASPVGADRECDLGVAEPRGGAGSKGKWRPRSGKIAPATASDNPPTSPSQAWNKISNPLSVSSQLTSSEVGKLGSRSVPNMAESSNDDRLRKKRLSRGAVVPLSVYSSEENISGSLQKCTPVPNALLGSSMTTTMPTIPQSPILAWSSSCAQEDNSEAEISTQKLHVSNEKLHSSPTTSSKDSPFLGSGNRLGQSLPNISEEMDSSDDSENLEKTNSSNQRAENSEQVQEYKQFLQKLKSSSTGTVVSITPAPKHQRTSYTKHKQSKIGIENDLDSTSVSKSVVSLDENGSGDKSLSHSGPTRVLDTQLFEIPQSIILPVLPLGQQKTPSAAGSVIIQTSQPPQLSQPLREQEKYPKMNTSLVVASVSQSHGPNVDTNKKQLTDSMQENSSVDQLLLEDVNEWIPPENKRQPHPRLLTAVSSVSLTRDNERNDLELEDTAIPANSPLLHLHGKHKKPSQQSSSVGDLEVIEPPDMLKVSDVSTHDSVVVTSARLRQEHSTAVSNHTSTGDEFIAPNTQQISLDKLTPTNKLNAFTAVKEMSQKKRSKKTKTKSKQIHLHKPAAEGAQEESEVASTPVEKLGRQQPDSEKRFTADSLSMPLLKVKSTTSLFIPDLTSTRKRDRDPPGYSIHSPTGSSVMAPPCPLYGTVQPTDAELVKTMRKQTRQRRDAFGHTGTGSGVVTRRKHESSLVDQGIQTVSEDMDSSRYLRPLSASSAFNSVSSVDSLRILTGVVSDFPLEPGELHLAARDGNHKAVGALLREGHNINGLDPEGRTPLMYCILPEGEGVHITCANVLIKMGANLDHQAVDGSTALHMASYVGAVSLIELLLMNGADPDIRDCDGRLPIHWATKPKSTKPLILLLKASAADVNTTDGADMTPLMWAAYNRNSLVLQWLMDRRADCEEKDKDGRTAMHWAVHRKDIKCLWILLKPDMTYFKDYNGCTVMHWASRKGALKAAELILKLRGDSVFDTDKKGHTPLHYAMAENRVDVCNLLLNSGADATQCDMNGMTPLDYARLKNHPLAVALMTCHEASVADFTRQRCNTNQASFLTHSSSFSDLTNGAKRGEHLAEADNQSVVSESLSMNIHQLNKSTDMESTLERNSLLLSQSSLTMADVQALAHGSYLGLFTKNIHDPPLHYYFWVNHDSRTLCWSRKNNRRNKKEAKVFSVQSTPSELVTSRPDFSPTELHKHAFWVVTNLGVVNMLAYSEQAYVHWIKELEQLAVKDDEVLDNEEISIDRGENKEESDRKEEGPQACTLDPMFDTSPTEHQSTTLPLLPATGSGPDEAIDCTRLRTPPIASSTPLPTSTILGKTQLNSHPFNPNQLKII